MSKIGNLPLLITSCIAIALCLGWVTRTPAKPEAGDHKATAKLKEVGHPPFMSPHAAPIAHRGNHLFVANTPADTLDVIHKKTRKIFARVAVGIDPVSVAVRPDGNEIWVANHVSDSVSVIDNRPKSPTYLSVIATVQDLDLRRKSTRFDEPVGIAFADDRKAYVALSSENRIAVVDVAARKVTGGIKIPAQDPRAIRVRNGRLYVLPFESNNKTQLSGGYKIDGDLVTFNAHQHSIAHNNVLSIGHTLDIIKHPRVPDRDLFVYDTSNDKLVATVDTLGTLLFGLAIDSKGGVFIAQTDARNDANGRSGTKDHSLKELENRPFLNQITHVGFKDGKAQTAKFFDLELLPPAQPKPEAALATPFAIEISADDKTLVASAASSDKIFTVDAASGKVLGQVGVGAVPRGIVLESDKDGKPTTAWVLNAIENSVTQVDVSDPSKPQAQSTVALEDPSHAAFKRGRINFNSAVASTTRTFSCASCHPDGHTDQLLWVLKTPIVTGGDQIMPRSTMPLRGLRDTAPFHWDGIPGDPYGGNNSANVHGRSKPNSRADSPESAVRHLIDGSFASTMSLPGKEGKNDEGKAGALDAAERDDLAKFLLNVTYPPAQRRAYNNELSNRAREGFDLFHLKGNHEGKPQPNVCGDCHRMPFLVSTNTPGTGMDAPTWRGAYDRFLILPQGRLNIIDFDFYRRIAEEGIDEREMWRLSWRSKRRFDPVWDMVLESSTGYSGSLGRQFTLSKETAEAALTKDLLDALEASAAEGAVILQVEGVFLGKDSAGKTVLQFDSDRYRGQKQSHSRMELIALAKKGEFVGTFTGRHGENSDYEHPQPALWTLSSLHDQSGRQQFPVLYGDLRTMRISGRHVQDGAHLIVDGRRVRGSIEREKKGEHLRVKLDSSPPVGMHFLQVQNPDGLFSNDFIFHVVEDAEAVAKLRGDQNPNALMDSLADAIARGNLDRVKRLLKNGAKINSRRAESGALPLSDAAFHGKFEVAKFLIKEGARVDATNRDGNTPLHVAAFMCREDIVDLLLEKGASPKKRNGRRETSIDTVSGKWDEGLAGFYRILHGLTGEEFDAKKLQEMRPKMAEKLRRAGASEEK